MAFGGRARRVAASLALLLVLAGGARAQEDGAQQECDSASKPGEMGAVKAVVVDDKTVDVAWLPPGGSGCFTSFRVTGKAAGGAALPTQTVNDALTATFSGLKPGATYDFSVAAAGPAGSGPSKVAKAATPPAFLDARPDAPEGFEVTATSDAAAKVTWGRPAGNPKVDSYKVTAVPVNATGFPLSGRKNLTFTAAGSARSLTASGLAPDSYYVFMIESKSARGTSPEPAVSFHNTPAKGAAAPAAPKSITAAHAGDGDVALQWNAPAGSGPDYYQIGITEVDGAGKALSATNTVPIANTSTIVRDLTPGATYKFAIESYSTAYDGGKSAAIVYTVPTVYAPPTGAPRVPPPNLVANVYSGHVQLLWEPVAGASSYVVSSYDAYSGRTLGVQYRTNQNSLTIYGLPMGTAVELVVQGVGGGYYSEAASTVVEIPYDQSYYYNGFSPYWGYNPALPYWYSSYYPIGWYNVWYPGKWAIYGIADALNPFNDFYGPGWWYNRPYPISPLWPLRPGVRPPVWSGGWGSWGGSGLINNRPRPVPLPGQRPPLTARPAPLPDIVRPSTRPAPGIATTRPAPGVPTTRPTTPTTRPAPGVPTTRPAPGVVDAGGRPTTRPATPDLRPAPGSVGNGLPTTRPAPGVPTTRPAPGGFPTTQPYVPTTRPAVPQMPTTRPAVPQMPMTRPAPQVPMARPAVPQMPMTRPAMPQPQMPMARPAMPAGGMARGGGGGFGGGGDGGGRFGLL